MSMMASQITSIASVFSTIYSGADQRKHQSSASLDFVLGIHRSSGNSRHKRPVTRKMLPFDNVIMSRWNISDGCWNWPLPIFHQTQQSRVHSLLQWRHISARISQLTRLSTVCSSVDSGWHQMKHRSSASLAHCVGNPPFPRGFPSQRVRNADKISMSWRHYISDTLY